MKDYKSNKLIADKLRIARESILRLGQTEAGIPVKISQSAMSGIENAQRESIPKRYLIFLAENGVNLSGIFNMNVSVEDYSAICEGKVMLRLPAHGECPNCKTKDQMISDLRDTIKILKENIGLLNKSIAIPENKHGL